MFRVLVIEHSITRANVTVRALNELKFGARVNNALSMTQAVLSLASSFTSHRIIPDIILMSDLLPDAAGLDALKTLTESVQARGIPIVVVAGWSSPQEGPKFLEAGACAYVQRSSDLAETVSRIGETVAFVAMVKGLIPKQPQFFSAIEQSRFSIGDVLQVHL